MIVAGYVGALVLLFVLAVPVAFALAGTSILVTLMERGIDFNPAFMVQKAVSGIDNFMLLSVPFFIYAGKVMNVGGITVRIYAFARAIAPHVSHLIVAGREVVRDGTVLGIDLAAAERELLAQARTRAPNQASLDFVEQQRARLQAFYEGGQHLRAGTGD